MSYTIKSGDTLGAIAARNGTTVAELAKLNGLFPPYTIYEGKYLILPTPESQADNDQVLFCEIGDQEKSWIEDRISWAKSRLASLSSWFQNDMTPKINREYSTSRPDEVCVYCNSLTEFELASSSSDRELPLGGKLGKVTFKFKGVEKSLYSLSNGFITEIKEDGSRVIKTFKDKDGNDKKVWNWKGGYQCPDLIVRYADMMDFKYPAEGGGTGDGKDVATNFQKAAKDYFELVDPTEIAYDNLPKPGAVISFRGWSTNKHGHVAIVSKVEPEPAENPSSYKITLFDQNWGPWQWKTLTFSKDEHGHWSGRLKNSKVTGGIGIANWANPK